MHISEIFESIQGEGILAGTPSAFIRTSGCNLRCSWCDTSYTSWNPEGEELDIDHITSEIDGMADNVVITGGEPFLQPELPELCREINDRHRTIETNATVYQDIDVELVSMSPKLSNSTPMDSEWGDIHEEKRINHRVIDRFISSHDYQLKFVVSDEEDIEEIEDLLESLKRYERNRVLLMPEGVKAGELREKQRWVADLCRDRGFRFSPRLHIHLFGNKRGV